MEKCKFWGKKSKESLENSVFFFLKTPFFRLKIYPTPFLTPRRPPPSRPAVDPPGLGPVPMYDLLDSIIVVILIRNFDLKIF